MNDNQSLDHYRQMAANLTEICWQLIRQLNSKGTVVIPGNPTTPADATIVVNVVPGTKDLLLTATTDTEMLSDMERN